MRASDHCILMLESLGLHSVKLYPTKGFWKRQDVYRWEFSAYMQCGSPTCHQYDCLHVSGGSWFTMKECAKCGSLVWAKDWRDGEVHPRKLSKDGKTVI